MVRLAPPPGWVPQSLRDKLIVICAERVGLHVVDLPVRSARNRKAALPFALEEALGGPLTDQHVAWLETYPDGRILAAVVGKAFLRDALSRAPQKPVVPEQMLLPAPTQTEGGTTWSARRVADRILVRSSDGTGFAADAGMLAHLWQRAGKPTIQHFGDPLPDGIKATDAPTPKEPSASDLAKFDLRQGAFRPELGLGKPLKWLAASLVLGLAGHVGLALADLEAQAAIADTFRKQAATALQARVPAASVDDPPALVQRRIAAQATVRTGSGFLPLMNQVSQAWLADGTSVQLRELTWSEDALKLVVEAPDLEALQKAEASLADRGMRILSGSATADAGSARAEFTVRP